MKGAKKDEVELKGRTRGNEPKCVLNYAIILCMHNKGHSILFSSNQIS
jgi:hypothetical protein